MAEKVNNLLSFENVVKLCTFLLMGSGLYYSNKQEMALLRQEVRHMIETYKEKETEAKIELAELKEYDKEQAKELAALKERLVRIYAVLPKRVQIMEENEYN